MMALCGAASARAAEQPPFKLVRSDEDYGYLRATPPTSAGDRLRFMPLDDTGSAYLSLGGEARIRLDTIDAPRFGVAGEQADTFGLARFLFSADLRLSPAVRIYGELGLHRDLDKTDPPAPSDRDGLDAQLLFADLRPSDDWRFRLGRQELTFNAAQRFISVREGPNIRQAFDGVRVTHTAKGLQLDAFYLQPVAAEPGAFNDERNRGQRFYGLYGVRRFSAASTLDLYVLGLERDDVRFGTATGDERRTSVGGRLAGARGAFDYDVEGMVQRGRFAGRSIRAWGGSAAAGWTLRQPWKPRLGLRVDMGSGDGDPTDRRLGTFNPLFPRGAYFNEASLNSWANLRAIRPSLGFTPRKAVTVEFSYLARQRYSGRDAIYLQPMTALPGSTMSTAKAVGDTIQADAAWQLNRNLKLQFEALHQNAGPAVRAAGGHDVDFGMAILQYRF